MTHRMNFSHEMDLLMLREVLATQVFEKKNGLGWKQAHEVLVQLPTFPPQLSPRAIRERTTLLMQQHKKEDAINSRKSGIEEEVTEKSSLLEELLARKEEGDKKLMDVRQKGDEDKAAGEAVRQQAMVGMNITRSLTEPDTQEAEQPSCSGLQNKSSPVTPPNTGRKRKAEENIIHFLEEREKNRKKEKEEEMELKKMELEMQRARQDEEMRLRRESEEASQAERRAFIEMMQAFIQNIRK